MESSSAHRCAHVLQVQHAGAALTHSPAPQHIIPGSLPSCQVLPVSAVTEATGGSQVVGPFLCGGLQAQSDQASGTLQDGSDRCQAVGHRAPRMMGYQQTIQKEVLSPTPQASPAHLKGAASYKGRGMVVGTVAVVEFQVVTACEGKGATSASGWLTTGPEAGTRLLWKSCDAVEHGQTLKQHIAGKAGLNQRICGSPCSADVGAPPEVGAGSAVLMAAACCTTGTDGDGGGGLEGGGGEEDTLTAACCSALGASGGDGGGEDNTAAVAS
jgi:hypothetical protein